MRFDGRGVIVTGAAQGIGRGIVAAFVDEGARVFAADITADGLERTKALAPDRIETSSSTWPMTERRGRWLARRSDGSGASMPS